MPILGRLGGVAVNTRIQQALAVRARQISSQNRDQPLRPALGYVAGSDRMCGAPGCTGAWSVPWKSRRRPIFEQEWGCSTRCLATLVKTAVKRETGDGAWEDQSEPHRHRVPLGLVLLAQGWISHPQLQTALEAQRTSGRGRIGDWLSQGCGLAEERIARGLGVQWSCPVLTLDGFSPTAMALVMPKRLIAEFGLVPLRFAGSNLIYLAFEERMDAAVALSVEQMCGLKAESGLLSATAFETARGAILATEGVPVQMQLVADSDELAAGIIRALEKGQPIASRLVRVHQYYWLRMWLESGALTGTGTVPTGREDVQDCVFLVGKSKRVPA